MVISMLNTREAWIKAAVEHHILEMQYYSGKTKREVTIREVEPDFVGTSRNGANHGFWATFCHLRNEGPRCFSPETILSWKATGKSFEPSPMGRWKELENEYQRLGLGSKEFS